MAEILPLTALRYEPDVVGPLQQLLAPPYDVIDDDLRAQLAARSPYNVVHVDLPRPGAPGADRYAHAASLIDAWRRDGALVHDETPAIWALAQEYTAPDGRELVRQGFLCRVRIEDPSAGGRIRPHERTHPGPKQDRLQLTRATRANLSPIFSLYSDPGNTAWGALQPHVRTSRPFGEATGVDGTRSRLWRITEPSALETVIETVAASDLLIADGHHRYETARAYADEIGPHDGPHRWTLMCLVALEDPGLVVFPTHRLVTGLRDDPARQEALAQAIQRDFVVQPLEDARELATRPNRGATDGDRVRIGYIDAHFQRPYLLTLKDQAIADVALPDHAPPYRRLDTAVLEALLLKGALGMSDASIDRLDGLAYARDLDDALARVRSGAADAAFVMGPTPIEHVREVAAAGEHMPPKSTFFVPKVPTGLVLNPLADG